MLVDIPVTVTFDHDNPDRKGGRAMSKVFTMRYDTDPGKDVPALLTADWPPQPNSIWITDAAGILFTLLPCDVDMALARRTSQLADAAE